MRIKINLINLLNASTTPERTFGFTDITYQSNFNDEYESGITSLSFTKNIDHTYCDFIQDEVSDTFTDNDILQLSNNFIIIDGNLTAGVITNINWLLNNEIIDLDVDGYTSIHTYTQNSENNVLDKDITLYSIIQGQFNHSISVKNVNIDIVQRELIAFNYVWIPSLNRYYYVDSVDIISADVKRIHLKEDVLMSWQALIKEQEVFVTRYGNSSNTNLVDERRPLEDVLSIEYVIPTSTALGSLVNTTFDTELGPTDFKFLISSISSGTHTYQNLPAPTGTNLQDLSGTSSTNNRVGFISESQLTYLTDAVLDNDNISTFINSVILLPFNPYYPYSSYNVGSDNDAWLPSFPIQASDMVLCTDGKFHKPDSIPSGYYAIQGAQSYLAGCPYFITADFTIPEHRNISETINYLEHDPYTTLEIYLAFVGWIKLNTNQVLGKRIITYYTLDYKTGMGTAFIYNVTDSQLIYSCNCQLGVKIDLTTTNTTEITRQKQANELNMLLGLMTSALSIGVGVASENPVAVAGGILSAGKTIASYVNSNNMMFERAQTSFGTSEGVLHSIIGLPILRYSYHDKVSIDESTYQRMQGYPFKSYVSELGDLTDGYYVEVGEIHFNPMNETIYQDEISEIVDLLHNGVIL